MPRGNKQKSAFTKVTADEETMNNKINRLYQKYDNPDTLVVVTLYPKKGEVYSEGTSGVASYAKNIIAPLHRKTIVIADYKDIPEVYEEKNVLVIRCFKRGSLMLWPAILKELKSFSYAKTLLVQFDFAMYGDILVTSLILPFLTVLRFMKFKTSVILHHVVSDVFKLSGHVGLSDSTKHRLKGNLYNLMFHSFYRFLGTESDRIIVLEEILEKKLQRFVNEKKIVTIPHGVDTKLRPISKPWARKKLGLKQKEFVVLFFGFVNWFKGTDIFAETFAKKTRILGKKATFLVAGGASPTMKSKGFYNRYYQKVLKKIHGSKTVKITGYVPQKDIGKYFSAADLVVFPYRYFMTASGVLSLTFSYEKPFIVSENLTEMFNAHDFARALKKVGLKKNDLSFKLEKNEMIRVTEKILKNGLKAKMVEMAQIMKEERSYSNVTRLYENVLFQPSIAINKHIAFTYNRMYGK